MVNLGKLEKVELREVWKDESAEFTPWLAAEENIKILADTLGIELEVETIEKSVGSFQVDILCKDTASDRYVIIENQLEKTDHNHLGQILTYAAGIGAQTIVWVASRFTDEHRAALDWLNENTGEDINFFGLEIELWRIGDSPIAPKFNVVAKPNEWSKDASRVKDFALTEAKKLQLSFWQGFKSFLEENKGVIKPRKPQARGWMHFSVGKSGFNLCAIASFFDSVEESFDSHEVRAQFEIKAANSKEIFNRLLEQKETIEAQLGEKLTWFSPEGSRMCRIYLRKPTDLNQKDNWPSLYEWLEEKLEKLDRVFRPLIRDLA